MGYGQIQKEVREFPKPIRSILQPHTKLRLATLLKAGISASKFSVHCGYAKHGYQPHPQDPNAEWLRVPLVAVRAENSPQEKTIYILLS